MDLFCAPERRFSITNVRKIIKEWPFRDKDWKHASLSVRQAERLSPSHLLPSVVEPLPVSVRAAGLASEEIENLAIGNDFSFASDSLLFESADVEEENFQLDHMHGGFDSL